MTRELSLIELLSEVEIALEDHSYDLSTAQYPSLTVEERSAVIVASRLSWDRLEAARRALDQAAAPAIA